MANKKQNKESLVNAIKSGNLRLVREVIINSLSTKVAKKLKEKEKHLSKTVFKESKSIIKEDVVDSLRQIIKTHTRKAVRFSNGETTIVDALTANAVITVLDALKKPESKQKFTAMANLNPKEFMKVVDFSFKQVGVK